MNPATRHKALSLYRKIFRIARSWQSLSGITEETRKEKQYICDEARTLFRKNQTITDQETIHQCLEECQARVEIGLHYGIPYPRPTHLPPLGLAIPHSKVLRAQQKLRKQAKPIYLKSHDEIS